MTLTRTISLHTVMDEFDDYVHSELQNIDANIASRTININHLYSPLTGLLFKL